MKFLHCADLHLDSPLRGLSRYENAPVDQVRNAARRSFDSLVSLAIEEKVSAVVIAGDIYDGERDDFNTAMYLHQRLLRLEEAGIKVVITFGNHDAQSKVSKRLKPPDNTFVLGWDQAETRVFDDLGLAFHGQGYKTQAVVENLAAAYPGFVPNMFNVGVLHTSLDGRPGHANYAPCAVDDLVRLGYQYWALGHIHKREEILRDGTHIVFPGNLCGRHANETGPKGATIVHYEGDRVTAVEDRPLAPLRWERCQLSLPEARTADDIGDAVQKELARLKSGSPDQLLATRVTLSVSASAYGDWMSGAEANLSQLRADATGTDGLIWLEKIELSPLPSSRPVGDEALEAIWATLDAMRDGEEGRNTVSALLSDLRRVLPPQVADSAGLADLELDEASFGLLLDEAAALLQAELGRGA